MGVDDIESKLDLLASKFDDFIKDHKESSALTHEAISEVLEMRAAILNLSTQFSNLKVLPDIAETNKQTVNELRMLRTKTFDTVSGKRQVPLDIFLIVVLIFCLKDLVGFLARSGISDELQMVVVCAICLMGIVLFIGRGSFKASPGGVEYKKDE